MSWIVTEAAPGAVPSTIVDGEVPARQDLERGFVVVAHAHDDGGVHRRGVEQVWLGGLRGG